MNKLVLIASLGCMLTAVPATANHIFTATPFPTRGECKSENARLSNADAERQFPMRPDLFTSLGEARSFMTRAFSCELNAQDGHWYLADHRRDVIGSEWFERRR